MTLHKGKWDLWSLHTLVVILEIIPLLRKIWKIVMTNYGKDPYDPKSTLAGEALDVVQGVENDCSKSFEHLEDTFGNR